MTSPSKAPADPLDIRALAQEATLYAGLFAEQATRMTKHGRDRTAETLAAIAADLRGLAGETPIPPDRS